MGHSFNKWYFFNLDILVGIVSVRRDKVGCPKLGHPALRPECYNCAPNAVFVAASAVACMLGKKQNHHSKTEIISKLTVQSQFLKNYCSHAKNKILI